MEPRVLWLAFGVLALLMGGIGLLLPVVPTTPFLLVAAWAFSKSSPRLHRWLRRHPRFGKSVRDWEDHRAMSRRGKWLAIPLIVFAFTVSEVALRSLPWLMALLVLLELGLIVFLLRLPTPEQARHEAAARAAAAALADAAGTAPGPQSPATADTERNTAV